MARGGTLVVGDVHGCSDELDLLIRTADVEQVVLVGDLFTKGPDPVGVFELVRGRESVLGNHDVRLIRRMEGRRPDDRAAGRVVDMLDRFDRSWRPWLRGLPLFLEVPGFTVVHAGVHPSGSLEATTKKMATLMRRFPMGEPDAPFWHQLYVGDRRVIFGHDAVRGLVRVERAGLPWLIGLDTGCVYGGELSGYLVEEDRVLQVRSAKPYWDLRTKPV